MKIVVGSDHAGFGVKNDIVTHLKKAGHDVEDIGTHSTESVDYPDFGWAVARTVAEGGAERGILVCGTGIGVSMTANKMPGIRAALCHDEYTARLSRQHNDANVLCVGARVTGPSVIEALVDVWLTTGFEGGRHQRRVDKIMAPVTR